MQSLVIVINFTHKYLIHSSEKINFLIAFSKYLSPGVTNYQPAVELSKFKFNMVYLKKNFHRRIPNQQPQKPRNHQFSWNIRVIRKILSSKSSRNKIEPANIVLGKSFLQSMKYLYTRDTKFFYWNLLSSSRKHSSSRPTPYLQSPITFNFPQSISIRVNHITQLLPRIFQKTMPNNSRLAIPPISDRISLAPPFFPQNHSNPDEKAPDARSTENPNKSATARGYFPE